MVTTQSVQVPDHPLITLQDQEQVTFSFTLNILTLHHCNRSFYFGPFFLDHSHVIRIYTVLYSD